MPPSNRPSNRPNSLRLRRLFPAFGERIPASELFRRSIAHSYLNSHAVEKGGKTIGVEWKPTAAGQLAELRHHGSKLSWSELKPIQKRDWRLRMDRILQEYRRENKSNTHDAILLNREWVELEKELDRVDHLLAGRIPVVRKMGLIQLRKRLLAYSSILLGINGDFYKPK